MHDSTILPCYLLDFLIIIKGAMLLTFASMCAQTLSTSSFQGDIRMPQRTFHTGSSSLAFRVSAAAGEGPAGKTGVGFVKPDKVDMSLFPPPSRALSTGKITGCALGTMVSFIRAVIRRT